MEIKRKNLEGVKRILLVTSGKGGVGKSTVATNLAVMLSQLGYKIGLMDADIFGPSIPIMFGVNTELPEIIDVGAGDQYLPINKFGVKLISIGNFIKSDQAIIWRGLLASKTLTDILNKVLWHDLDLLIIDMPPGTSDIHITIAQEYDVNGAIIVTTPQAVASVDALKSGRMLQNENIETKILGVIENMSYFQTEKLKDEKFYIFGKDGGEELAKLLNTDLLGQIPIVEEICYAGDAGNPFISLESPIVKEAYLHIANQIIEKLKLS